MDRDGNGSTDANRLVPLPARAVCAASASDSTAIETGARALQRRRARGRPPTCRHCHRTPLVGEHVHVYGSGRRGEEIVCELCRPLRTAAPERTVLVRSAEQRATVRAVPARS